MSGEEYLCGATCTGCGQNICGINGKSHLATTYRNGDSRYHVHACTECMRNNHELAVLVRNSETKEGDHYDGEIPSKRKKNSKKKPKPNRRF